MRAFVLLRTMGLGLLLAASPAWAEEPPAETPEGLAVGAEAPAVTSAAWLNTVDGQSPIGPATEGKVLMLEFWGTWCGPCVRAMPHVQELHDRYGPRGLVVIGITRETAAQVKGWIVERHLTFPIGCDPEQVCVKAFQIRGWPSTYLIGRDGSLLYVGTPYGVEPAIEAALGLESGPGTLLRRYIDALAAKDTDAAREALGRLAEKAGPGFDLRAWALGVLEAEPPAPAVPPKVDAAKALAALGSAGTGGDPAKRTAALTPLAQAGPTDFDLQSWARAAFGKAWPLTKTQLEADLAASRYGPALDALLFRNPPTAVAKLAAKHDGFVGWCKGRRTEVRADARRALMAIRYVFADKPFEGMDEATQERFWKDISVSGMATSEDEKQIVGILIGGAMVMRDGAQAYVRDQLLRYALMTALVDQKPLKPAQAAAQAAKEQQEIVAELERTY